MADKETTEAVEASASHVEGAIAALAAICRAKGLDTSIAQLRRLHGQLSPTSQHAPLTTLAPLVNLDHRSISSNWQDLNKLKRHLPVVLQLTNGGVLLLEGLDVHPQSGPIAVVRDPLSDETARVVVDQARLEQVWDGAVVMFKRRLVLHSDQQPFGLPWLLNQVLRERRLFGEIGMAALINTFFVLAPPFVIMVIIDRVLVNHSLSTLNVIAFAILAMLAFETVLGYLRRVFMEIATLRIDGRLNLYIMDKLLKLPMSYFETNPTGRIMSKFSKLWQIRQFLTGQLLGAILDAVPIVGLVPALLILDWRLSMFVFAMAGITALIIYAFIRPLGRAYHKVVLTEQEKSSFLVETIYGMRTIKSLALEGRRRSDWDRKVANALAARHGLGLLANYPQTFSLPFERIIYSGSFILGAYLVLANPNVSPGSLLAFSMLAARLASPLIQIAKLQQDLAEAQGAVQELATIMNEPSEDSRVGTGLRLPIKGDISFQGVHFRYTAETALALDDVSFEVPKGSMLGVMGRSGSGKTTLTRLLQGLHRGYEGIIKIDGMDLREIDLEHLRTNIGVVLQENFLFSGTIRENIAMARPSAPFGEIVRAAQQAGAEEFIERLPRGYDTMLEEGAQNLSGGQRQRLAIARALLIDPPILVLDEATSALDAESETIINANLQRIAKDRTVICISHRLSMLVPADKILVLERGQAYDIGRHEELLVRCDIYKQLWHQQNRHSDRPATAPSLVPLSSSHA